MPKIRALIARLVGLLRRDRADEEFSAELESHVAMHTEDGIRSGLSPEEARRQALIHLRGAEQTRQAHRERRLFPWLESVLQDLSFGLRTLRRSPSFTLTAVVTLAVGIGASTAIFSAVKPILLDPLPYPHSSRLMMLWEMRRDGTPMDVTFGTFRGLEESNRSFEAIAVMKAWQPTMNSLDRSGHPERPVGQRVSADYFKVLGVSPLLGRAFQTADDRFRGPNVVIVSDRLWRRRFNGDSSIIGKQVRLDDNLFTVIGVMPGAFENVLAPDADLWAPLQYNPSLPSDGREWGHHLRMFGRLNEGVGEQQARNELSAHLRPWGAAHARGYDSSGGVPDGMVMNWLQHDLTQAVRPALLAVFGAVLLVLLIACANVANLLLARGAQRHGEFAVRAALGATRRRLIVQLITESMLLSALGGALGMSVALVGMRALVALSPAGLPRVNAIAVDGGAFLFATGTATLIGIAVGLILTLQASRFDLRGGVQQSSRNTLGARKWTRSALVVTEVALAVVLMVSAGLLLRSMQRLFAVDPGFDASHLLTMQIQDSGHRDESDATRLRFFAQALDRVRQLPGVVSAGFTSQLPLSGDYDIYGVESEIDRNPNGKGALRYAVTPGYLEAMRIPLRQGRLLNDADTASAPVAIVINESLANRRFAGINPIGQHVRIGPDEGNPDRPWATVVGVVGNVKQGSLAVGEEDAFYVTTAQWAWADAEQTLVVRTRGDAALLTAPIREAIWSVDNDVPIVHVASMETLLAASASDRRFVLVLLEAFGLVALSLSAIGIYGVLSGNVAERTREIGVRAALGATRGDILALVMRQGLGLTCLGILIGLCGAFAAARSLATMLFGVTWLDSTTYLAAILLLLGVSGVACFIPARRAASVDPMQALRAE